MRGGFISKRQWYQFSIKKYEVKKLKNKKVDGHAAEIKSELQVGKSAEPDPGSAHTKFYRRD